MVMIESGTHVWGSSLRHQQAALRAVSMDLPGLFQRFYRTTSQISNGIRYECIGWNGILPFMK